MGAEAHDATVEGEVVGVDQDLARVLIGDLQEEWFFPLAMLPAGTRVGSDILFTALDGRYSPLGFARGGHTSERSIEDRLSRPLSARRTGEIRRSDLG